MSTGLPLWGVVSLTLVLGLGLLVGLVVLVQLGRLLARDRDTRTEQDVQQAAQRAAIEQMRADVLQANERTERELRADIGESARGARQELAQSFAGFQQALLQQAGEATRTQNAQIDAFATQLALMQKSVSDTLHRQLSDLSEANARRLSEMRATIEGQLAQLQQTNAEKLEQMRVTVDEKLQSTLQARLGESFKQVADRLEQVHRGLGEMQTLAGSVGDLKHLLTNVKTRGMFGEAQLGALLEQVFAPEQYAAQIATRAGSRELVDFAVRLPGRGDAQSVVWLPIDAKFPSEDYERLLDAQQRAHAEDAALAARALEQRIRLEARSIADKYLEPPQTTDFAILFLPSEGLYAEVLRRPGLMESLQRDHRVTLAGPTTLLAMLNALQMGFRTLALEKRASEVWQVLGAVKNEFGKFGDVLAKLRTQTQTVMNTLDAAQTRSNVMQRHLRQVEALPDDGAARLLAGDGAAAEEPPAP